MLDSPAYAVSPRFTVGEVEDSLYLLGGRELLTIGLGPGHRERLMRLLAGAFTAADLRREFPTDAPAVEQLIDRLAERRVVVPAVHASADLRIPLDEAERNGGDRAAIGDPLAPSVVARIGIVGDTDVPLLDAVLAASPTVTRVDAGDADLVLAFASPAFLVDVNRRAIGSGQCWLPIPTFDGRFQRIGPVVIPGVGPCFECADLRWASTTAFPDRYAAVSRAGEPGRRDGSLDATVLGLALRYAVRWLYGHDWLVASNLLVYEPKVFETGAHPVFRVARCGACGPTAGVVYPWRA